MLPSSECRYLPHVGQTYRYLSHGPSSGLDVIVPDMVSCDYFIDQQMGHCYHILYGVR